MLAPISTTATAKSSAVGTFLNPLSPKSYDTLDSIAQEPASPPLGAKPVPPTSEYWAKQLLNGQLLAKNTDLTQSAVTVVGKNRATFFSLMGSCLPLSHVLHIG